MARPEPLPNCSGKPRVYDRCVLSGIILINPNGLRWCDASREYGPHTTLYNRRPTVFLSAIALATAVIFWL